jgi:hypothetical protein
VSTVAPPVETVVRSLAARGWTMRQFRANHLEHVAHVCLGDSSHPAHDTFHDYWRTVGRISSILQREAIDHVIIKTRRSYRYADTNVDVFVKESDSARVQAVLRDDSWRMPSRAVIFKQRLIEREKLKLPARAPGLVPAHLYMAVSWRYQREVTFLDEAMVEHIPIRVEAPGLEEEWGDLTIPVPTRGADVLLHCAEIVFENYRLTLGEALYLAWLVEHLSEDEVATAMRLAAERGAGQAMRVVLARVRSLVSHVDGDVAGDWPRNLTARELLSSWGERFGFQLRRRRVVPALEEWSGYAAFGSMYRVKRTWFDR